MFDALKKMLDEMVVHLHSSHAQSSILAEANSSQHSSAQLEVTHSDENPKYLEIDVLHGAGDITITFF